MKQRYLFVNGTKASVIDADNPQSAWQWSNEPLSAGSAAFDVRKAYGIVPHLRRAIDMRASAMADMPRHWYRKTGEEVSESELPWAESFTDILSRIEASLCVAGAAYVWRMMAGSSLLQLRWFASASIKTKTNPKTGGMVFERSGQGLQTQDYTEEEIASVFLSSPFVEKGPGIAPAATCLIHAGVIANIAAYSAAFFERGAINPTILSIEGNPSPDDKKKLREWWGQVVSGIRNAFTTQVLTGGAVKATTLTGDTKSLAMPELSKQNKEDLATGMGIPYSLLFSDAANFATAEKDKQNFYDLAIKPDAKLIAEALNAQVFEALGLELYFAPEELACFQADEKDRAASLQALTASGMPIDIATATLGYNLDTEHWLRLRLRALSSEGFDFETSRALILASAGERLERITPILDAIGPRMSVALPAAAPLPAITSTPTKAAQALAEDLEKWQRKAMKRLTAKGNAACDFESAAIAPALAAALAGVLEGADSAAKVRRAFAGARRWAGYP